MTLNSNFLNRRSFPAILLILFAGIIVYANTFHVPFILDDQRSITQNEVIKHLDNYYANSIGYEFVTNRLVVYLTFALNYHFGGLDVTGYHVVNLLIHLVSALLIFALLRLTFGTPYFHEEVQDPGPVIESSGPAAQLLAPRFFIPLFGALLFVVHPVQTQAVTYIVQRMTSLATMFYLLSIVLYVQARLRLDASGKQSAGRKSQNFGASWNRVAPVALLVGAVLSAVLAMRTKEIAFTLPLAAVLYEVCFFRGPWKRRLLYILPLLATLPIVPITVIHSGGSAGHVLADSGEQLRVGTAMPRLDYLLTQLRVIVTYLRLLVLPVHQNLDYDYPIYHTFFTVPVFLPFLLLAALFAFAMYLLWRTRFDGQVRVEGKSGPAGNHSSPHRPRLEPALRLVAFGVIWFFLTLSVESSFIPIRDVIVEHRLYLPSFGMAAAFATAFCLLAERFARPAVDKVFVLVAFLLILGLGFATYQRNHVWGNSIRLWEDVVAKSPKKGRPLNNLGVALEDAGRRREAFETLSRAVQVDPGYYKSYYNLADLYVVSDRPDAALPLLRSALRLKPDFTEAYVGMGAALLRGGHYRQVIRFLSQNLDRVKENAEARFYLGAAYAFLGNREAAMRELAVVSRYDKTLAANLAGLLTMRNGIPHGRH